MTNKVVVEFENVLKVAEKDALVALKIAAKIAPEVGAAVDVVLGLEGLSAFDPFVAKLVTIITGAGAIANTVAAAAPGVNKLAIAVPAVDQLLKTSGLLTANEVADEAKYAAAVEALTGNFADLVSALKPKVVVPVAETVTASGPNA
jgi:hypothetical protein